MNDKKLFSGFNPTSNEQWRFLVEKELKGIPFDSLVWKTGEGFDVFPFYTHSDVSLSFSESLVCKDACRWRIRQDIHVKDCNEANKEALEGLNSGADSLNFILDKINEKEFKILLREIIPEYVELNFTSDDPLKILKLFLNLFPENKTFSKKLSGSVIFSPVKNNIIQKEVFDVVEELSGFSSSFRGVTISSFGEVLITKQISKALANGYKILYQLGQKDFSVEEIASRIQFSFPVSDNYFFEIAKIRAVRILWAKMLEKKNPDVKRSFLTYIHSHILPDENSEKDNRFISNSSRVMSAAIGGADSISIESDNSFSQKVNRNIQLVAMEESNINKVADISAGSYYIEALTEKIAEQVQKEIPDCFT